MNKFGKDRIALFLACMSVLGNEASAANKNKLKNQQTVVAVGGGEKPT